MRVRGAALICIVLGLTGGLSGHPAAAADLKQQLASLWESCYRGPHGLRTSWTRTFNTARGGRPEALTQKDAVNYALNGPLKKFGFVSERFKDGKLSETFDELTITNPAYEAVLGRAKKEKDAWVLREIKSAPSSDSSSVVYGCLACPWLICGNNRLPDWVTETTFTIVRADALDGGVTRVHFVDNGDKTSFPSGWLDVDMERRGLILGYEFNMNSKFAEGKEIGRYEYVTINGKPVLKSRTIERPLTVSAKYGNSSSRETDEYETELKAPPEDEFYLSFYGLPEPPGLKRQKSVSIYLWLLAGGFVSLAAAIVIRKRHRWMFWAKRA